VRLDLTPGETSAWHCHDRDYVIVVLESDGGAIAEEKVANTSAAG
jgi:hypothetical protein